MSKTLVRVPGQFSPPGTDFVVATPTCCCCCCCCLVSSMSFVAYNSAIVIAETRKVGAPKQRRFRLGLLAGLLPLLALVLAIVLGRVVSPWATVLAIPAFVALQLKLVDIASGGKRPESVQAKESILMVVAFALVFVAEAISLGFFLVGQLASLIAPFLIGNHRAWKGVDRPGKTKKDVITVE